MQLTDDQRAMLAGEQGRATQKAIEILTALGTIYDAQRLIPAASVQISGVSYANLGEAGLQFLSEMADQGGKVRVVTTLNPAGMDVENWPVLGIDPEFARNQQRVLDAFERMGVITTCTCTPYLVGYTPAFGEHIAWAESSAVCYANSVLGARTNREGGPSALAAALTGFTPYYGLHLDENRQPGVTVEVTAPVDTQDDLNATWKFGTLGKAIGLKLEARGGNRVPYILGLDRVSQESMKSFCASIATFGGVALFHIAGLTPEADQFSAPAERIAITAQEMDQASASMQSAHTSEVDFVSLGCPHLSIKEIARIADLLEGRRISKEFWITTARPTKRLADKLGYTARIEASGVKFAADTCCVVAPIQGRFKALATDSAKACYYAASKNGFETLILPFEQVVQLALA